MATRYWTEDDPVMRELVRHGEIDFQQVLANNYYWFLRGTRLLMVSGMRIVSGKFDETFVRDDEPPGLGDIVTDSLDRRWVTPIPARPGVIFWSRGELSYSPAYEDLSVCVESTWWRDGATSVVRQIAYVTRPCPVFERGLADGKKRPPMFSAGDAAASPEGALAYTVGLLWGAGWQSMHTDGAGRAAYIASGLVQVLGLDAALLLPAPSVGLEPGSEDSEVYAGQLLWLWERDKRKRSH